jgi:hypothetical protein
MQENHKKSRNLVGIEVIFMTAVTKLRLCLENLYFLPQKQGFFTENLENQAKPEGKPNKMVRV